MTFLNCRKGKCDAIQGVEQKEREGESVQCMAALSSEICKIKM